MSHDLQTLPSSLEVCLRLLVWQAIPPLPQHRSLAVLARGSLVWTLMQSFRVQMECTDTAINCARMRTTLMLMVEASYLAFEICRLFVASSPGLPLVLRQRESPPPKVRLTIPSRHQPTTTFEHGASCRNRSLVSFSNLDSQHDRVFRSFLCLSKFFEVIGSEESAIEYTKFA